MFINLGRIQLNIQFFPLLAFVVIELFLLYLGIWQLHRADQKAQRLQQIAKHNSEQAPHKMTANDNWGHFVDNKITLSGYFDQNRYWLVENRVNNGKVGFDVIGLFNAQQVNLPIIVNMGWVPATPQMHVLTPIEIPRNQHDIVGIVRTPTGNPFASSLMIGHEYPKRIHQVAINQFEKDLSIKLTPYVLLLDYKEPLGFEKHWKVMVMQPEKHHAYAMQWFGLAFVFSALMIWRSASLCPQKV